MKKDRTAYHEAGHLVADMVQGLSPNEASILKMDDSLGRVRGPNVLGYDTTDGRIRRQIARMEIISCYAGMEAELIYCPTAKDHGGQGDNRNAFRLSEDFQVFPRYINYVGDDCHRAYLEKLRGEARKLIKKHWGAVRIVAEELLKHKKLDKDQIEALRSRLFPEE